jgi:hypothetical protein
MAKDDNNNGNDGNGNGNGNGNGKNRDYDVGYGKPPKHSRWKSGQSGNPRGPKKGSRGIRRDLHKALEARHSIRVNGKVVKGTSQELALYALATRAAAGDIRAIRQLIDVTLQVFGPEDRGRERNVLPKQDQELLDRLLDDMGPERGDDRPDDPAGQSEDPYRAPSDEERDGEQSDEA